MKTPFFYDATISAGVYKTSAYMSKTYRTRQGLIKGLKAHSYPNTEVWNGVTWNVGAIQYKLTFNF